MDPQSHTQTTELCSVQAPLQSISQYHFTSSARDRKDSAQIYKDEKYGGQIIRRQYLGLWTLEERKNRQDLIELFMIFQGQFRVGIDELFMLDENMKGQSMHLA